MEEISLEEWIKSLDLTEQKYYASFDNNGSIISVGMLSDNTENKIEVDKEFALDIISGNQNIFQYKVDIDDRKIVRVSEIFNQFGYVLHRVIEDKWTDEVDPDILITCNTNLGEINFKLSPRFNQVIWQGHHEVAFFLTEYNDLNMLKSIINVNPADLKDLGKTITNVNFPKKFSIFTKPIFKTYTVSIT